LAEVEATLGSHVEAYWMIREQKGSRAHADRPGGAELRRLHARNASRKTEGHLSTQDRSACPIARGRGAAWPDGFGVAAEQLRGILDAHSLDNTMKETIR
jgi:hypothetical protein